ncbi:MAG: tRNA (guanosine(37)-N1)-methyltransferase TrmD [candidate division WOR-3 bacterium]|nr:tRNA (guanosine(37)-N1)-methyltransferase TrmD [candidate division WOR-3 bacterium]
MNFNIITLFPELIIPFTRTGIIQRAIEDGNLSVNIIDLRDFGEGRHNQVDDYPYGGGSGMILMPGPLKDAVNSLHEKGKVILTSPAGRILDQTIIENELSEEKSLTIIAGRYKGIDQRFIDHYCDTEISIGNYILQGGEIPALIILESVSRLADNVIGNIDSARSDSFSSGLLDPPQYTRPSVFEGHDVPDILLSGNHGEIDKWRKEQSLKITMRKRPEIIERKDLTNQEEKIINIIKETTLEDNNE